MTKQQLSAADFALRQRITELSVHIPCGRLRGPVEARGRWQSCRDEDSPEKWKNCDVSEACDLCIVCLRGTAGGSSRWSWLGCEHCRAINIELEKLWGFRPLALGRHSLMNGIGIPGNASPEVIDEGASRLMDLVKGWQALYDWRDSEFRRLAAAFDSLEDVPLRVWQQELPPSHEASADAFSRLLGRELPLLPPD